MEMKVRVRGDPSPDVLTRVAKQSNSAARIAIELDRGFPETVNSLNAHRVRLVGRSLALGNGCVLNVT